jgi:hypothetical protein
MMDYYEDPQVDGIVAERLLEEEWTHSMYRFIDYYKVATTHDVVFQEQDNKSYTKLATFQGKVDFTPTEEMMREYGVDWEEGVIMVEATRLHLDNTYVNVTNTSYKTLLSQIAVNDVLQFPTEVFPDEQEKQFRITQIIHRAWYGNTPMIIAFRAIVLPEFNK